MNKEIKFGENCTMGDVLDVFNSLELEEDFITFYKEYWKVVERTINKEQNINAGDKRTLGLIFERVRSNLYYLVSETTEMRKNYAYKVWWFILGI